MVAIEPYSHSIAAVMRFLKHICGGKFARDESGAVTVDWIVLTATIVLLGTAMAFVVGSEVPVVAETISSYLANTDVAPPD